MNVSTNYKMLFLQAICGFCFLLTASTIFCISITKNPDASNEIVKELNNQRFETVMNKSNAQLYLRAAEILMLEIKLAQIAQVKGTTIDIKELGKINERFISQKYLSILQIALLKSYSIPTTLNIRDQEILIKLHTSLDQHLDKNICNEIAQSNDELIKILKHIVEESKDNELVSWAENSIPGAHKQSAFAMICQNKFQ